MSASSDFTWQFREARAGDSAALNAVLPAVYDELKRIARAQLSRERAGHTLQPTALVHEAYLRLLGSEAIDWTDRAWFIGMAATMMRRILINHARDRMTDKRGAGAIHVELSEAEPLHAEAFDLLGLHAALEGLQQLDERQARVVELKYFGGMEIDEIAAVLSVSSA
ncbi:MAG: RNA polymerase subunit sigma-70, partial [Ahniella sp.]|nr:RNA polymerase subunit sigma-70 [Ahniella sp.]